eukprot:SAG31_NODE_1328_length_8747_cov_11.561474_1_plen_35_part_00
MSLKLPYDGGTVLLGMLLGRESTKFSNLLELYLY